MCGLGVLFSRSFIGVKRGFSRKELDLGDKVNSTFIFVLKSWHFIDLFLLQFIWYLKKNFILNFFLVLLAFSSKPTALCFALYIFYYDISFYKKFIYFFLLLILAPIFYILFNEFNYFFLGNIWSFYNNFENTLRMNFQDHYYNNYIIAKILKIICWKPILPLHPYMLVESIGWL